MSTVIASYPCCGKPCRLSADPALPVQSVERRHFCEADDEQGTLYRIERRRVAVRPGIEINKIEFLDLASTEAIRRYGVKRIPRRSRP